MDSDLQLLQDVPDIEDMDQDVTNDMSAAGEPRVVFKTSVSRTDRHISEEQLSSLYESLDINSDQVNRRYTSWRLDVIHIRGVEGMSSEDVLKYFEAFDPNSIEWVNDLSCNVVFTDPKASAIAMTSLTNSLVLKPNEKHLIADIDIAVTDAHSLSVPVPPGFRWRLGAAHHKSKALLLRFATTSDKKITGARDVSEYYVKHGVPSDNGSNIWSNRRKRNHQTIRNTTRDEPIEDRQEINDSEMEFKTKRLRMRMRADDEQDLIRDRLTHRKPTVGPNVSERQRKSIWERLDNDSHNNSGAVDTDLLQLSFDSQTNSRTIWSERPMRSSISVVKKANRNVFINKNDLRTKITKRKSY